MLKKGFKVMTTEILIEYIKSEDVKTSIKISRPKICQLKIKIAMNTSTSPQTELDF